MIGAKSASSPSDIFGPLFSAVQSSGIFDDSKLFADAIPRRNPAAILADWNQVSSGDATTLRAFVDTNFELPVECSQIVGAASTLTAQITNLWSGLTRTASDAPEFGSSLPLPQPFIVPGGRFRELYYWDSYFTMLGLRLSGRQDLVEDMILNFGSMLDQFGHIPNGSRTYYLSRSHPPVFYLAAGLSCEQSPEGRDQRLNWMLCEHRFWMAGEDGLQPGSEHRRLICLNDGSVLNRYWDDRACPRDESWAEDVALAAETPDRNAEDLWLNIRAAAESGWDFSSRWLADGKSLGTIRTTRLVPIDLNCLLFGLEQKIASESAALGFSDQSDAFLDRAARRAAAMSRHLWNDAGGFFADYDLDALAVSSQITAAAAFPLFCRSCSPEQAKRSAVALRPLVQPKGLLTTLIDSGQQWDAPNGWAPLQWIASTGLQNYGETALADSIASGWSALVEEQFLANGQIYEKYDVVAGEAGHGGEYGVEIGFGWTNGVVLALQTGDSK